MLAGSPADQVVLHCGEVGWRIVGADAAFVVAEDHIHYPVHAFDAPVFANSVGGLAGTDRAIGQVESGFA